MAVTERFIAATPEDVFAVLSDGWLYPAWVVGAARMRAVDADWPAARSRLHHSFGAWPFLLDDTTVCLQASAPQRLVLRARGWPAGEAHISIDVREHSGGCLVRLAEKPARGPALIVPRVISDALLHRRNRETLRRLAFLAEGRRRVTSPPPTREQRDDRPWSIRVLSADDAGPVLTLQRAAFASEALIYGDPDTPALTQTLDQLKAELKDGIALAAADGARIVGAIRAVASGSVLMIGRIAVAPDMQGEGVGSALLDAAENEGRRAGCTVAELFTGSHSDANLALYRRLGYEDAEHIEQGDGTAQVFLRKPLGDQRPADSTSVARAKGAQG